jgi:hypothetical protein
MGGMCDTDAGTCIGGGMGGGGAGGGFPFPGLDGGGLPGLGCGPNMPCGAGQCCASLGPLGTCQMIGMSAFGLGTVCGISAGGGSCAVCGLFGGSTCNMTTGMCQ